MLSIASVTVNEDLISNYEETGSAVTRIYEPQSVCIVLGAGRKNRGDLLDANVRADSVPVLIRRGGGGTVVLSPGMIVVALVAEAFSPYHNKEYARTINSWISAALIEHGVGPVEHRGISDLTLNEMKILGTSIFRRRSLLFYQASLLVNNDLALFARYLSVPTTAPDYRAGRGHNSFCTNLSRAGYEVPLDSLMRTLKAVVAVNIGSL